MIISGVIAGVKAGVVMGGASWHRRRVVETEGVYVELALGRWGNAIVVGVVFGN